MLDRLPYEVLETTTFWLAHDHNGGTYPLTLFLLISRTVHDRLLGAPWRGLPANHALFVRLFKEHFDSQAFERRFHIRLTSSDLAAEYKKRIGVLRRSRNPQAVTSAEDLWTILLMIYEDDGNNMRQLLGAGVEERVKTMAISTRNQVDEHNWPIESHVVRLLFAIISLVGSVEGLMHETPGRTEALIQTFACFLYGSHQYPTPHSHITLDPSSQAYAPLPQDDVTEHAISSIKESTVCDVEHFGRALRLATPSASEGAICAYFLRKERIEIQIGSNVPKNRTEADARNWGGATVQDWQEFLYLRHQALGSETPHAANKRERDNLSCLPNPLRGSERFDVDFWRLCSVDWKINRSLEISKCWFNTVYTPGILTGKWFGRLESPDIGDFLQMVRQHPNAPSEVWMSFSPVQFYLREHVTTDLAGKLGYGHPLNAWLPDGIDPSLQKGVIETSTGLTFNDSNEPVDAWQIKRYQSLEAGVQLPKGEMPPSPEMVSPFPEDVEMDLAAANDRHPDATGGYHSQSDGSGSDGSEFEDYPPCVDVCLIGETSHIYGLAWNAYKVYGRVRKSDGLIMLVRAPLYRADAGLGRCIFTGYLRASTTIVGQWRTAGIGLLTVGTGGPFMLSKIGEMWGPSPSSTAMSSHGE